MSLEKFKHNQVKNWKSDLKCKPNLFYEIEKQIFVNSIACINTSFSAYTAIQITILVNDTCYYTN